MLRPLRQRLQIQTSSLLSSRNIILQRQSFTSSSRLLETPSSALPVKKPIGAFRGGSVSAIHSLACLPTRTLNSIALVFSSLTMDIPANGCHTDYSASFSERRQQGQRCITTCWRTIRCRIRCCRRMYMCVQPICCFHISCIDRETMLQQE